jgi:hypothetical protein
MLSSLAGWFRPALSLYPSAPLNQHRDDARDQQVHQHRDADHAEGEGQRKMK